MQILAEMDRPIVLMLDEVPICVNRILKGEEHAVDHLEAQLHLIEELGETAYLAEMIKHDD